MRKALGEILIQQKSITPDHLEIALRYQVLYGGKLGTNLVEMGVLDLEALTQALAVQLNTPPALHKYFGQVTPQTLGMIARALAEKHHVVPLGIVSTKPRVLAIAMANPLDAKVIQELTNAATVQLKPVVAPELRIVEYLEKLYGVPPKQCYVPPSRTQANGRGVLPESEAGARTQRKSVEIEVDLTVPQGAGDGAAVYSRVIDIADQPDVTSMTSSEPVVRDDERELFGEPPAESEPSSAVAPATKPFAPGVAPPSSLSAPPGMMSRSGQKGAMASRIDAAAPEGNSGRAPVDTGQPSAHAEQQGYANQAPVGAAPGYANQPPAYDEQQTYASQAAAYAARQQAPGFAGQQGQPPYGNQQPAYAGQGPQPYRDQQPAYPGQGQPPYGNQQPAYSGQGPQPYRDQQPAFSSQGQHPYQDQQPAFSSQGQHPYQNQQPAFSGQNSQPYPDQQPAFSGQGPHPYQDQRPAYSGQGQPPYPDQQPAYSGQGQPPYPDQQPAYSGQGQPPYPDQQPVHAGQQGYGDPPAYDDPSYAGHGHGAQGYGASPPGHAAGAPGEQQQPGYGDANQPYAGEPSSFVAEDLRSASSARPALDAAAAAARISSAGSRDEVGDAWVDYLRSGFGCALVLIVRDEMALGWRGFTPSAGPEAVESVAFPLTAASMLRIAYDRKAPYRGAPPEEGEMLQGRLWKLLRIPPPEEVIVAPVLLKDRVVLLVQASPFPGMPMPDTALAEIASLCATTTTTLARLIRSAKPKG